jgi:hypothetical protein
MTETEIHAQEQLDHAMDDVHMDGLRHPDPSGSGLPRLLQAAQAHIRDEAASVATMRVWVGRPATRSSQS